MNIIKFCNRSIEYSFYALFFLVPLVFYANTSELFELNKMWVTWSITVIIAAAWFTRMILQRRVLLQRSPLDIPIVLFLVSQIIATLFSLDQRISLWGYYSRFNGGLLSTISYIFLYYAFVSNLDAVKVVKRLLTIIFLSGLIVTLWGLPSHFGTDPTCFVFRGNFDVTCWTEAFRPTIRMFSTLGQPAWLAAYLAVLIPLSMAYGVCHMAYGKKLYAISYTLLATLFYLCLLYANTRAGFLGFWVANIVFWTVLFVKKFLPFKIFIVSFLILNFTLCTLNFFIGTPVEFLNKYTYQSLTAITTRTTKLLPPTQTKQPSPAANADTLGSGITDSGNIRLYVWKGAIDAWKANPIFGTGVETFALAYYKHRPAGHNMTSEWDYLYNKAHNEYLNYLTTTGAVGLGTYIIMLCLFLWFVLTKIAKSRENHENLLITIALLSGYVSILVSNFFGFSVVIVNLFLFLIPALTFVLNNMLTNRTIEQPARNASNSHITVSQWFAVSFILLTTCYILLTLYRFWNADQAYALGSNLAHAGAYQDAYPQLQNAVTMWNSEPVFKDELSITSAQLALGLYQQKEATVAAGLAKQAVELNTSVLTDHPNNIIFWKSRIRIFYALSQIDQQYIPYALKAAEQASELAPTDAKIWYNLAVLYGQTGDTNKAITTLNKTLQLKPEYVDAYYALGLFYHDKPGMEQKAIETMHYILEKIDPKNEQVKKTLREWGEQ